MKINNILYISLSIGIILFFAILIIRYLLFNINKPIVESLNIGPGSYDFSINSEGIPIDKDGNPVYDYNSVNSFGKLLAADFSQYANVNNLPNFGFSDSSGENSLGNNNSVNSLLGSNGGIFAGFDFNGMLISDVSYVSSWVDKNMPDPSFNRGDIPIKTRDSSKKRTQRVYGNDGSVSCQAYCAGGGDGRPWNNELPADWNGAQCKEVKGTVKNHRVTKEYPTAEYSMNCDSSWNSKIIDVDCECEETGYGWKTSGEGYFYHNGSKNCSEFCNKGGGETGELVTYSWYGAECVDGAFNAYNGDRITDCCNNWTNSWPEGTTVGKCKCRSTGKGWDDYSHYKEPAVPVPKEPVWFTGNNGSTTCSNYCRGWNEQGWQSAGQCVGVAINKDWGMSRYLNCNQRQDMPVHCLCRETPGLNWQQSWGGDIQTTDTGNHGINNFRAVIKDSPELYLSNRLQGDRRGGWGADNVVIGSGKGGLLKYRFDSKKLTFNWDGMDGGNCLDIEGDDFKETNDPNDNNNNVGQWPCDSHSDSRSKRWFLRQDGIITPFDDRRYCITLRNGTRNLRAKWLGGTDPGNDRECIRFNFLFD